MKTCTLDVGNALFTLQFADDDPWPASGPGDRYSWRPADFCVAIRGNGVDYRCRYDSDMTWDEWAGVAEMLESTVLGELDRETTLEPEECQPTFHFDPNPYGRQPLVMDLPIDRLFGAEFKVPFGSRQARELLVFLKWVLGQKGDDDASVAELRSRGVLYETQEPLCEEESFPELDFATAEVLTESGACALD